jgi:hypothetical protein
MLAVAFSMPIAKVRQLRDLFQEIDRNGNGVIGKYRLSFSPIFPVLSSDFVDFFRKRRISSSDDASSSGVIRKRH